MRSRRCQSCGLAVEQGEWIGFIGAAGERIFKEAPIHLDCAAYSFSICPHLIKQTRGSLVEIALCRQYRYVGVGRLGNQSSENVPLCLPSPTTTGQDLDEVLRRLPHVKFLSGIPRLSPADLAAWVGGQPA